MKFAIFVVAAAISSAVAQQEADNSLGAPSYGSAPSAPSYGSAPSHSSYGPAPSAPLYGPAPSAPSYGPAPSHSSYGPAPSSGYGAPAASYSPKAYGPIKVGPATSYNYQSIAPTVPCPQNLVISCSPSVAPVPCQSVSYSKPSYAAPAPSYGPAPSAPSYGPAPSSY